MKCQLCNINEADKKGSHLIPDFILRTMLVEGDTNRRSDKIVSNKIDVLGTDVYIGREIDQDKVSELFGRELTDEEMINNRNHYTVDDVFCTKCENRFSFLETLYKSKLYDKLRDIQTENKTIEIGSSDIPLFKLFWISIVWRCSCVKFQTFSLKPKDEKRLRELLDFCLGSQIEQTKKLLIDIDNEQSINSETLGILFAPRINDYLSNVVFCNPFLSRPYTLVINDFLLLYYEKEGHIRSIKQSMYKLENYFTPSDYVNLKNCKTINIGIISETQFETARNHIYGIKASRFNNLMVEVFSNAFEKCLNRKPSKDIISGFVKDVIENDDVNEFERYTRERIKEKIKKNIYKYVGQ